jgi:hypothetical protein
VENKDEEQFQNVTPYGDSLSGGWLLRQRLLGAVLPRCCVTKVHIPRYSDIIGSLIYINHNRNVRQSFESNIIDVYIRPELSSVQLLDYHKYEAIIDIGYLSAKRAIAKFRLQNATDMPSWILRALQKTPRLSAKQANRHQLPPSFSLGAASTSRNSVTMESLRELKYSNNNNSTLLKRRNNNSGGSSSNNNNNNSGSNKTGAPSDDEGSKRTRSAMRLIPEHHGSTSDFEK